MTHRGPFQPLPFCDSVISTQGTQEQSPTRSQWRLTGAQTHWYVAHRALESLLLQTQVNTIKK